MAFDLEINISKARLNTAADSLFRIQTHGVMLNAILAVNKIKASWQFDSHLQRILQAIQCGN